MAENAETMDELEHPAPKKSPLMLVIMVVNLLLVGGVLAFLFLRSDGKAESAATPAAAPAGPASPELPAGPRDPGPIMVLENFIVNLADQDVNRYLKLAMSLELASEDLVETVRKREPLVRDAIISMLSSLTYQEIRTSKGKDALKRETTKRLYELLGPGQVVAVYFTEFVVQ